MPIVIAACAPERSLVPPFAFFASIFPKYNYIIKKRERKEDGKTAKDNSREQDLSVTFSCCMSKLPLQKDCPQILGSADF